MSNVNEFPKPAGNAPAARPAAVSGDSKGEVIGSIQVVTALLWPILKWLLAIDVAWQFVRMVYHWKTPGNYGGWTFLVHFAILVGLTYFVAVYRQKPTI
jgi:hypothetical protein